MDRLLAMQIFVETVDLGSFSAAAEKLNVSRVLATRYIAHLETWQGRRLLQRSTRRLSLTSAGASFLEQCRAIIDLTNEMEQRHRAADREPRGKLRIATNAAYSKHVLTNIIADYLEKYPKVQIDLLVSDKMADLIRDQVDLAIRVTNDLDPSFIAKKIGICRSVVCASPGYLKKTGKINSPEEFSKRNCLTYSYYGKSEWRFRKERQEKAVLVQGNFHANDLPSLIEGAVAGMGLIHVPNYMVTEHLKSGELKVVCSEWEPQQLGVYYVYLSRKHLPASLRTFLDFLGHSKRSAPTIL